MKQRLLLTVAAFGMLFLGACARQTPDSLPTTVDDGRWQRYAAEARPADTPYRIGRSLRFGEEGNTRRVTALLWGNGDDALRLDVMAGVGALVASVSDAGDTFLIYAPREHVAYVHEGRNKPLLKSGVPVPFSLSRLSALLRGHYAQVFGTEYRNARPGPTDTEGSLAYLLEGRPGGLLCLDERGRPVRWQEKDGREKGWIMDIDYGDDALPHRLKLSHDNGKRAILLIKEREKPAAPFAADAMRLELPANTRVLPLEKFRRIDD